MEQIKYKDLQQLADKDALEEIEASRIYMVDLAFEGQHFKLPRFIELRMHDPDNPFIIITDIADSAEFVGYLADAKKEKWFETYQSAFESDADWYVSTISVRSSKR